MQCSAPSQILKLSSPPVKISSPAWSRSSSQLLPLSPTQAGGEEQPSTARLILTRPPECAETRSSPKRALFHRARSGSKGMPWVRDLPLLPPRQNLFSLLLPFPTRGEVAGWADQLLLRAPFTPALPSAPRRALHPSEHILIVRVLRAGKLAVRLTRLQRTANFPVFTSFTLSGWQGGVALSGVCT